MPKVLFFLVLWMQVHVTKKFLSPFIFSVIPSALIIYHSFIGRIQFYDQYGVIRDVLQNHLTEVMTLMLMNLPANLSNSKEILQNKLNFLASLQHADNSNAVVGQYQAYNGEVQEELNKTKDYFSFTPTFAGEWKSFVAT